MSRIAAPGLPLDAVQIAEAAAREVGAVSEFSWNDGRVRARGPLNEMDVIYKASLLGRLATDGPNYMVCCIRCAPIVNGQRVGDPCTPVSDALRGITCDRGGS